MRKLLLLGVVLMVGSYVAYTLGLRERQDQISAPTQSHNQAATLDQQLAAYMPGGCDFLTFQEERIRAARCLAARGKWINRETTCRGRCEDPDLPPQCSEQDVMNTDAARQRCTNQGGLWFDTPGAQCFGECWPSMESCFGKIITVMEMWYDGKARGSQLEKPLWIDSVTCNTELPSLDH